MAWSITEAIAGSQPIADTSTVQNHPLLKIVTAKDPTYGEGEFIYLKGVASTVAGDWVGFAPGSSTTPGVSVRSAANGTYPLAVAMSACNTTTLFGWYQISGTAYALGLTSITHTSGFLALASAGALDDASVIGDHVFNARKTTTVHVVGTFLDYYSISRPYTTNVVTVRN